MKSKLKRIFSKARWYILMLVVGLVLFITVPFIAPVNYQSIEGDGSITSVTPQSPVSAGANSSGKLAIIDDTIAPLIVALTDTKSSKADYIVGQQQLELFGNGSLTTYQVAVDDDDNMYLHCIYWIKNEGAIEKEEIVKISSEGKYEGKVFSADYYSGDNESKSSVKLPRISQLSCSGGKLGFAYSDNDKACVYEVDCKTGTLTEGQDFMQDSKKTARILSTGKGYLVTYSNGEVYKTEFGKGKGELVYKCSIDIDGSSKSSVLAAAAQIGDKLYVTKNSDKDKVYELKDGQLTEVYQLDTNQVIYYREYDGKLMILTQIGLKLFDGSTVSDMMFSIDLPFSSFMVYVVNKLSGILMLIGVIGIIGFLIFKRKTLLTKQLLLIIPTLLVVSAGLFYVVLYMVNSQRAESSEHELTAVCELSVNHLQGLDVSHLRSLDSIDEEEYYKLRHKLTGLTGSHSDWGRLYTFKVLIPTDSDITRVLAGSDMTTLPNERGITFYTEDELEQHRLSGGSISLFSPELSMFNLGSEGKMEAVGRILDSNGDCCAYLLVTADSYTVVFSIVSLLEDVIIFIFFMTVLLIVVMTLFSVRISRQIRKTTKTVSQIASGDFSARAVRKSNDELGEICTQVNKMAQNLETMFEEKDKNEKFYYKFVPEKFRELLGKEKLTDLTLGDAQSKEFSVLFCDIRAFSLNSEMMTAKEIFEFVNIIYGIAGPIIRKHGGFVDKYIGDAVMALFESADAAVEAGIEIYRSIVLDSETAQRLKVSEINIGIGIHTGMAEIGIVGEEERLSGTVISDTVNLSSRLESLTKTYKTAMLISKDTLDHMKESDTLDLRYLGMVQVAGVNEVRSLYEVLDCLPDEERQLRSASKSEFREALRLFHMGERGKAIQRLQALVDSGSDDHITKMYLQYMQELSPDDKGKVFVFVRK